MVQMCDSVVARICKVIARDVLGVYFCDLLHMTSAAHDVLWVKWTCVRSLAHAKAQIYLHHIITI